MLVALFSKFLRVAPRRKCVAIAFAGALTFPCNSGASDLRVIIADDAAPDAEFVNQLRDTREVGSRFELLRLPTTSPGAAALDAGASGEDRANAGVRTRGIGAGKLSEPTVTIAVGAAASRAAIERSGEEPLVLAMLTRIDYENLKSIPAFKRADRRLGVLLRDPAMADQLALIDAILPSKRRLGVVATVESEPLVNELQHAAQGWDLQVEYAPNVKSLGSALQAVLARSDALMVLPDMIGNNQAATLAVLRAGAGAGIPVFGTSEGLVRSGGLAAAVSTPTQLATQARSLAQKIGTGPRGPVSVEAATPSAVRINTTVARGLGLRLPDERELTDRVTAVR